VRDVDEADAGAFEIGDDVEEDGDLVGGERGVQA
jgi:hypothetical protein